MAIDRYAGVVLGVLTAINALNVWDRWLLSSMVAVPTPGCGSSCEATTDMAPVCEGCPAGDSDCLECITCRDLRDSEFFNMMDDICITSEEYGMLAGIGFTITFAICGLFAGRLSDIVDRKSLHSGAIMLWSAGVALQALADNVTTVLIGRILLGIGESFNAPCCYALLAYYFPPTERSAANGVYGMGTYLGIGLAALSIYVARSIGWRMTTWVNVILGIVLAGMYAAIIRQPRNEDMPGRKQPLPSTTVAPGSGGIVVDGTLAEISFDHLARAHGQTSVVSVKDLIVYMARQKMILALIAATSIRMVGMFAVAAYLPLYVDRQWPEHVSAFSLTYAIIASLGGASSSALWGKAAEMGARSTPGALGWMPATGILIGILPMAGVFYSSSFDMAMLCLLVAQLLAEGWIGPGMAMLQRLLPPGATGTGVAIMLCVNALVANLAPSLIALYDDDTSAVRDPVFFTVVLSYAGSGFLLIVLGGWLHAEHFDPGYDAVSTHSNSSGSAGNQAVARPGTGRDPHSDNGYDEYTGTVAGFRAKQKEQRRKERAGQAGAVGAYYYSQQQGPTSVGGSDVPPQRPATFAGGGSDAAAVAPSSSSSFSYLHQHQHHPLGDSSPWASGDEDRGTDAVDELTGLLPSTGDLPRWAQSNEAPL